MYIVIIYTLNVLFDLWHSPLSCVWGENLREIPFGIVCLCLFLLKESTWNFPPFSTYFKQSHNRSNSVLNLKCYAPFTRGVGVNAWRRACLKLGAEATVTMTRANHITFLVLHEWIWLVSELGYLHKANALPFEKLKNFSLAKLDVTPFKVSKRPWRRLFGWNTHWVYICVNGALRRTILICTFLLLVQLNELKWAEVTWLLNIL